MALENYVMVHERLLEYRKDFPKGKIEHEILELREDYCAIKVKVYDEQGNLLSDGVASETRDDGFCQKNFMLEVASTSALGRALAFCGYQVTKGIASKEEIEKAQRTSKKPLVNNKKTYDKPYDVNKKIAPQEMTYNQENFLKQNMHRLTLEETSIFPNGITKEYASKIIYRIKQGNDAKENIVYDRDIEPHVK